MLAKLYKDVLLRTPDCEQIPEVSPAAYLVNRLDIVKLGLPFIVRGFLHSRTDLITHLIKKYGDVLLSARLHTNAEGYAKGRNYQEISLADYFNLIENATVIPPYAANNQLGSEMEKELNLSCPLPGNADKFRIPNIWIGAKDTITPLHKDSTDNFAFHLLGTKRWVLFSVKDMDFLNLEKTPYGRYKHPLAGFAVSSIDIAKKLPVTIQNKKLEVVLNAGDLLYIPFGWGHFVENETITIMVNYWFKLDDYKPLILSP